MDEDWNMERKSAKYTKDGRSLGHHKHVSAEEIEDVSPNTCIVQVGTTF